MNRLTFAAAIAISLGALYYQSGAETVPVPSATVPIPSQPEDAGQALAPSEPAPAPSSGDTVTVTEYRTEYRDVQVCTPLGCQVVRQAVRVPVQVTRKVARAAAKTATAVVRSAVCACGCGGTCGGLCDCLNCSCKGAATGEVVRFHSVRTSPPVVTSVGGYRVYTPVYRPQVQRRAAWRPFARLRAFRGGCR